MKYVVFNLLFFLVWAIGLAQSVQQISGRITQMGQPLANVNVLIEQTGEGTPTDSSGLYKVETEPGNSLIFSYTGLRTIKIIVEDVTKILNIEMEPEVTALNEVTVTKKKLSTQQELAKNYRSDKDIIKTRFGYTNTKKSGWRTIVIDEDMIKTGGSLDLTSTIEARFIGIVDKTDPLKPKFYDRRTSTITERIGEQFRTIEEQRTVAQADTGQGKEAMVFDVDGQVFENFPIHITTAEVERIAIIPGNAAANIYSMRARGGVIVINTKGSNFVYEKGSDKTFDYERLRNNYYHDDTTSVNIKNSLPRYMLELQKATSTAEALNIYNEQNTRYGNSPYFKLNVADYFFKNLNEHQVANNIHEEVATEFSENPVVLKALAYLHDERKEWAKSTDLYKKILRARPKYGQSYRDLANSFVQSEAYSEALGLYVRYGKLKEADSTSQSPSGIDSAVESEYENVSGLYGHQVFNRKNAVASTNVWGARVLVEWNNSEAEFELQVIHPNTQFFTIDHTLSGNAKRIENEKKKGYSCEQIWFDYNDEGTWNINLKYLGNKSYDPTYFKITLYRNWGLPSQSQDIKVFSINEKNRNKNVLRFAMNSRGSR